MITQLYQLYSAFDHYSRSFGTELFFFLSCYLASCPSLWRLVYWLTFSAADLPLLPSYSLRSYVVPCYNALSYRESSEILAFLGLLLLAF